MKRILVFMGGAVFAGVATYLVLKTTSRKSVAVNTPGGDYSDDGLLEREGSLGV